MANLEKYSIPKYDKAGIYAVINRTKMMAYVGQSRNIRRRATEHQTKIVNRNHNVEEITKDHNDEFSFLILHRFYNEDVSDQKLGLYEKLYMLTLVRAGFELYNKNEIGAGKTLNEIAWRISTDLMFSIGTEENLNDAYYEKYGKHYSYDIRVSDNRKSKNTNKSVYK